MPRTGMPSIKYLFRIGHGPSSSHTMGPEHAALLFKEKNPKAKSYKVTLFGSLALTGKPHMTERVITDVLKKVEITHDASIQNIQHPTMMRFEALGRGKKVLDTWRVASVGGGTLKDINGVVIGDEARPVYPLTTMSAILEHVNSNQMVLWEYVSKCEGSQIWEYLDTVWETMQSTIDKGLAIRGLLPGPLKLERKADHYNRTAFLNNKNEFMKTQNLLFAYALACSEENASGGTVVTAPTCGSSGVVPSVAKLFRSTHDLSDTKMIHGLAIAALIGNLAKFNASILGAEVGCQGEVGVACAMASAMATHFLGGTAEQIEYAAEIALEHHLGLTCDPIAGLVQIPCIERNAIAATKALSVATYAMGSMGSHKISYDTVLRTMMKTGKDMQAKYKETSQGGLAEEFDLGKPKNERSN